MHNSSYYPDWHRNTRDWGVFLTNNTRHTQFIGHECNKKKNKSCELCTLMSVLLKINVCVFC